VTGAGKGEIVDAERPSQGTPKGNHASPWTRVKAAWMVVPVIALVASACSSSPSSNSASSSTTSGSASSTTVAGTSPSTTPSPGITKTQVTVGQVDDLSKPISGLFKGAEDGTEAYFDYINSLGGVNGRTIKLDAQDSLYDDGTVANTTAAQVHSDFALVGGFSLDDSAEEPIIRSSGMPDVAYPLDQDLSNLPTVYSPVPNPNEDYPLTIFQVLKKKFPTQIKHMGILWANATPSTAASEQAFERAAKSQGFKIVYDAGFTPSQTTFLANVLTMKAKGVQLFFTQQMPDAYAATVAKEMEQQSFDPINVEGDAYSSQLIKEGGPAVNNMYIDVGYLLYLDADASLPAVKLFNNWMAKADSDAQYTLQALYGWAAAELFVQGLRAAGANPTRASLMAALDKVTNFDANGLTTPGNPAQNIPGGCVVLGQVQNGVIKRAAPSPKSGFICSNSKLPAPGFKPEVRPASSS
jgi:ABC-type branched-subunit amino acid transport system substrate-binding protein